MQDKTMGFIGGGAMAEAIIKGIIEAGIVTAAQIIVNDISEDRLQYLKEKYMVKTCMEIQLVAKAVDVIVLAVKPQVISSIYKELSGLKKDILLVSIVAGVNIATIEEFVPGVPVVRVMPNTPVAVGEGMSAVALGRWAKTQHGEKVKNIFEAIGKAIIVSETQLDAVTGISGCGPGYAFVLMDALADAGVLVGLPRPMATMLVAQTLLGAAKMVLETGEHPAKLRDMVTSPGGITIQGIQVLEQRAVRAALIDTVVRTTELSREMGKKNE